MSYLKSKDGSIEASIKEMQKNLNDNAYQKLFKKELEKTGKGIGSMSDMEKKDFFNKLDKMYKGKDEAKVDELTKAQEKLPPALQKAIKAKEKNEDLDNKDSSTVKDVVKQLKKAVKAHSGQAKDLEKAMKTEADQHGDEINDKKKDAMKKGEKEPKKLNADTGTKLTKVETEPKVDYKN
jgi:imidazolonepropionase-like amidohydrolase